MIVVSGKVSHKCRSGYTGDIKGRLDGVMIGTMVRNARGVGSILAPGTIFTIFITSTTII